jgi:hypothetical protein
MGFIIPFIFNHLVHHNKHTIIISSFLHIHHALDLGHQLHTTSLIHTCYRGKSNSYSKSQRSSR